MRHETSYTQARQNLAALLDQVTETREPVLIQRRGREAVALIAADELAGWLETAHLLRSPENARRLLAASERAEAGAGEVLSVEALRERFSLLRQRRAPAGRRRWIRSSCRTWSTGRGRIIAGR